MFECFRPHAELQPPLLGGRAKAVSFDELALAERPAGVQVSPRQSKSGDWRVAHSE
jgi:hypothetical protein